MTPSSETNTDVGILKAGCDVNRKLLPFKLHFFFFFGGISATAVGAAYSLIPIFTFLSNPVIGFLVDYFQNIKVFLVLLLITSGVAFSSVVVLPPIATDYENVTYMKVSKFNDQEFFINFSVPLQRSCVEKYLKKDIECRLKQENQTRLRYSNESRMVLNIERIVYDASMVKDINGDTGNKSTIIFYSNDSPLPEMKDNVSLFEYFKCNPDFNQCSTNNSSGSIYSTYQFWAFFCLAVVAVVSSMTAGSLSIVASYELLGTQKEIYGRQRLFGTISWGIVCPLSGMLNDLLTQKFFFSGIYLMSAFLAIDVIILCVINLPKAHSSSNMGKDICNVFRSSDILVFSFGVVFVGILNSIIVVFEFWFLEDMGASRTLLGMSVFMQCIVGEVPFLFFSGWFVKTFGHFLCFAFSFGGFLLRLVLYFLLKNPWLVLPVDILHGVTFGVFHGAMTSFAKVKAPKGMEATLLGIFSGLYDGLGYGVGSFVGGVGLDKLGSKNTFLAASIFSLGCCLLFLAASFFFRSSQEKKKARAPRLELSQLANNE